MLFLRRLQRRAKGHLNTLLNALLAVPSRIKFHYRLHRLGFTERYVFEAFSALAGLDMTDPLRTPKGVEVYGCGMYLEINDPTHELRFTFQQTGRRTLVIHQWLKEERAVRMEYNSTHMTHWHEVYRTNRFCTNPTFITYLKELYGTGRHPTHSPLPSGDQSAGGAC